jgi:uncharacterized protein YbjT (DUF2867 family)
MSTPILVFGATGRVGGEVTRLLLGEGAAVTAAVRDPSRATASLPASASLSFIQANLSDPASLKAAAAHSRAERAFVYAQEEKEGVKEAVQALKEGGVKHIVLLSSWTIIPRYLAVQDAIASKHAWVEDAITNTSGLTWTFVRAGYFASNVITFWKRAIQAGSLQLPYPDSQQTMVTDEDMAAVIVRALTTHDLDNQIVSVTGAQALTQREQVAVLSRVLGKSIEIVKVSEQQWRDSIKDFLPAPIIDSLLRLLRDKDPNKEGDIEATQRVLGRKPMTFEAFIQLHKAELGI